MAKPSFFKHWAILSLAVLLVHLGLLETMPLALGPAGPLADSGRIFTTRAIAAAPNPAFDMPTPVVNTQAKAPAKSKPKPTLTSTRAAPMLAAAPSVASSDLSSTELANNLEPSAAAPAQMPASAPVSAPVSAITSTPFMPEPPQVLPLATPPAQERAAKFKADRLPASVKLIYKVLTNKFPYTLKSELQWQQQNQHYQASLSFSAFGQTRLQTSRGQISEVGLSPERFSDKYRSEVAAHFNQALGKVSFSANSPDAALLPGAQDRLSVLVQLGALVASDPQRYQPGTTLTLQTIGPREADLWLFTVGSTESLTLPGGTVQGLKLERNPRHQYDQKVELWLSPQLSYLPARIRITETNGDSIDQQWVLTEPADAAN